MTNLIKKQQKQGFAGVNYLYRLAEKNTENEVPGIES